MFTNEPFSWIIVFYTQFRDLLLFIHFPTDSIFEIDFYIILGRVYILIKKLNTSNPIVMWSSNNCNLYSLFMIRCFLTTWQAKIIETMIYFYKLKMLIIVNENKHYQNYLPFGSAPRPYICIYLSFLYCCINSYSYFA